MCFYRQTLLSVCLILPWGVFAQPIAQDDLATTDEDTNVVFNIVSNDSGGAFAIDPASVDLDVSSPLTTEDTFSAPEGVFSVSTLGVVTFDPADHFFGQAILPYTVKNTNPSPETTGATITVTVTSVNDVPSITSIAAQNINEDGQTSVLNFTINDVETDPDDLEVTALSDNPSLVGNLNIDLAGAGVDRTIQVTPIANQSGVANITITVDDGTNTNEITFALTVNPINDLPTITSIANQSINQDSQTGLLNFTIGDIETPVGSLTVAGSSNNLALVPDANIDVVGNTADRTVQVTPLTGQIGVATITLIVSDGTDVTQTTFELTVTTPNTPPTITAISDQVVSEDLPTGAIAFTIGDAETAAGSLILSGSSSNTTLVPNLNVVFGGSGDSRTVTVTPALNQFGITTITVNVSDGEITTPETFLLTVDAVNDPPTITAISDQVVSEDLPTGAIAFTIGDAETAAGSLTLSGSSSNTTLVPNLNVVFGGSGDSRTVTVTPALNQFGSSTITVNVSDGVNTTPETFLLTVNEVNDLPTITAISDQLVNENVPTGAIAFTVGDVETSAGSLTLSGSSSNTTLVPNLNIVFGGSSDSRNVTVTPALNQTGTATITVNVSDGVNTTPETFLLTVDAVNDPPTITAISDQVVSEDLPTGAIAFTIGDAETAAGSLILSGSSSNTTLVPNLNIVFGGSDAARTVTVTPALNQFGTSTITVNVSDGVNTTPETFLLTVNAVNDAPTITAISDQGVNEDLPTGAIAFTVGDVETAAGSLTLSGSSSNTTLVPNLNIVFGGSGAARTVTVTPALNQFGSSTITVNVSDGVNTTPETFLLTVNAVNDAPTITAISNQVVNEDFSTGALAFTINDIETAPGSLNVTRSSNNLPLIPNSNIVLGGSGANRTVTITPLPNISGVAIITLTVSDGVNNTPTNFQVTVNPVDDTPTISSIGDQSISENTQTGPLPFNINDVETSATLLTLTRLSSNTALVTNANVVLGGSGSLRNVNVIPSINQIGMTTITLTVSDGANSALTAFQVMVTNVDDPPTITPISDQTINEDASTGVLDFTVGDLDTGPGSVTPTGTSSNQGLIPDGNIIFGGSDADRTVQVTPLPNQNGVATITITVSDGVETSFITFDVTVTAVNDVPVFTKGANQTHNEDVGAQSISPWATAIDDGDPELSQTLSFDVSNNNAGLFSVQPAVSPTGVLSYTPAPNANGVATVTVTLSDNGSGVLPNVNTSASQNFTITINAVNDAPVFTKGANQILDENSGPQSVAGWATGIGDGDPELSQTLTFNVSNDNNALFSTQPAITSGGTLSYTPAASAVGSTIVTVTLSDNGSGVAPNVNISAAQTFTITISAVNSAPVFVKGANQTVNEDAAAQSISGWATGIDDGDPEVVQTLTFNVSNDNNALFSVQPTITSGGTLSYTPAANANGATLVTVTLSDNGSGAAPNVNTSGPQTFTITVTAINDAPLFTKGANQTVDENSAAQTVAGWATGISDGDPEVVQSLTFNVSNNNNALFSVQPAISSVGTLTYTPAPTLNGSATVTVSLSDNGSGVAPNVNTSAQQTFTITVNSINNAPSFVKGADQSVNEDAGLQTVPGWATSINDGDADLTQTLTFNVSNNNNALFAGQPSISSAGVLTYTPAANANGVTTVTVTLSDDGSGAAPNVNTSGPQTFTITVNAVNDVPAFVKGGDQTFSENSGPQVIGGWATGITDGDPELSQTVTFNVSNNNNSLFSVQPTITSGGTLSFTPAASANGVATVTVSLSDNGSGVAPNVNTSGPQTFTITITPVNDAPSFTKGANQTVNEDPGAQTVAGWATAIDDGDAEVVQVLTFNLSNTNSALFSVQPAISSSTGNLTYTPAANANGSVTVTVTLVDNGSSIAPNVNTSAPETFTITINPVNDPPTISAISNQAISEDGQTGLLSFTVGDNETAAASLVVTGTSSNTTLVPNANVILGGSGPSRTVNIIPLVDLSGVTTITLNVSDGTATTPMTFQVTVNAINDAPTITAIADQTVIEDTPTGALPFTIGDLDTPVGSLVITPSSSNTTLVPIANIVIGGSGASRTVTVSPANNQTGVTTITLTVSDGTVTTATDFDVTVTPVNDAPTITTITDRTINEDSQTGTINFTIGDAETAASSLVVTGTSSNTTLVPNGNIVLGGSGTSRTVIVIPAANQSGTTTITLSVNDGTTSVSTAFVVNVTAVNDGPLITAQTPMPISIAEVQPVVLALSHLTVVDPDDVYPTDFSLFVLGGANYSVVGTTVTPVPNFSGTLVVPVFVNDGALSSPFFNVMIAVASTNDPPVITGQQALAMNEDQTIALSLANLTVTDPDNAYPADFTLTVLAGANYTFTGTTVTPALNFNGTLVVKVKVNDGLADSPTFDLQITVNPVNDPPVITAQSPLSTNEDVAITLVISNFTVTDTEPTTYTLAVSQVAGANYTVSGNTVTPNLNYTGTLTVPVTVSDGFLSSASYNATITVVPVNDPPVITGQVSLSTIEDIPLTLKLSDLTVTDVDNTYPTGFSLTVLAGTNYTFVGTTITPVLDFVGTLTVNVRVNDGLANSATFPLQVQVTSEADVPKIIGQNPVSMNEDEVRTITVADLKVTDPDTPIGQITVTVLPGTNYTFTGNAITPIAHFFGTLTVNVTVNDGESTSNTYPLQVSVISINDPPTFNNITNVVLLEDAGTQTLTITGISPGPLETQLLLLSVTSNNTALIPQPTQTPAYNGSAATAVISFKPEPNAFGVATITVEVTDPDFAKHTVTFTITVNSVNDAPTLNAITAGPILEDAPEQLIPLAGISPGGGPAESGQNLSFIPSTDKPELFEVLAVDYNNGQATGTLRIKPKPNANGTAQITLRLQDDGSNSPPNVNFVLRTFSLVTTAVNDLPVITSEPDHIAEPGQVYQYAIVVTDVEGEVITLTVPTKPAWLILAPGANGQAMLSGTPPPGTTGNFDVVIEAKDPSGTPVTQPYTLTVNSRPVLSPVTIIVEEDDTREFVVGDFTPGFADADGNSLSELEITELPKRGTLKFGGSDVAEGLKIAAANLSSLTYTPKTDSTGRDTLRWNASDGFMSYSLTDTYAVLNVSTTNDAPVISVLETDTLKYELGSEVPVFLTTTFDGYDPDDDNITSAEIGFKRIDDFKYRPENDRLIFPGSPKITGQFDEDAGILALSGTATAQEYVEAIRSIKYNYTEAKDLLLDSRSVEFSLSDGQTVSLRKSRIITLVYTFSDLDIPTAFTPNGDKANEKWVISAPNGTEQYSDAELKVYNKRGLLVFKSTGLETPWDGIWNGEVLPSDVYFYTIELNYNKVKYKGTVTILR